jgi:hypothetical protein
LAALANGIAKSVGWEPANTRQSPVTAIDIAFEPDQTMMATPGGQRHPVEEYRQGFSLDATHHPHVSIFAGFVPTPIFQKFTT